MNEPEEGKESVPTRQHDANDRQPDREKQEMETSPASHEKDVNEDQVGDGENAEAALEATEVNGSKEVDAPYSILSEAEKITLMLTASFAGIISPISGSVYLPAVNDLARDLDTSVTLINLTISTYLIFQGVAPSFTAALSESYGRRPAYMMCFLIYLGANIGLALQIDYAALLVLRCLQSSGSSGTIALGSATVADLSTRAERGKYIGYAAMGVTLGPALGPTIGGLLVHFRGWRSIFWFLTILCGVFLVFMAVGFPETCRAVVGNGSVAPPRWDKSFVQAIQQDFLHRPLPDPDTRTLQKRRRHPNPLASVKLLRDPETALIVGYGALLYAGYMSVLSTLTSQLAARFHFSAIQVGLCYLPLGFGSMTSRWTMGILLDRNFKCEARKQGLDIIKNRQQDISSFDIEKARLTIMLPFATAGCVFLIAYGWSMERKAPLAVTLVLLFFMGHLTTGSFSALNTLNVDINREAPATASAAGNLARCLLAAGAVAAANPLIKAIGIGWTGTLAALIWVVCSPAMYVVYRYGHRERVRRAQRRREESPTSAPVAKP